MRLSTLGVKHVTVCFKFNGVCFYFDNCSRYQDRLLSYSMSKFPSKQTRFQRKIEVLTYVLRKVHKQLATLYRYALMQCRVFPPTLQKFSNKYQTLQGIKTFRNNYVFYAIVGFDFIGIFNRHP